MDNLKKLNRRTNWALALVTLSLLLVLVNTFSTAKYMEKNNEAWDKQVQINQKVIKTLEATPSATPAPKIGVKGTSIPVKTNPTILTLLNAKRVSRGLGTLSFDYRLANGATARATDLFNKNQWSHEGMNAALVAARLPNGWYSENLAKGYNNDPVLIVDAWEASPLHAQKMFDPNCTLAGWGSYQTYTVLWLGVCGQ